MKKQYMAMAFSFSRFCHTTMHMPPATQLLANAVAYLALAAVLAETRYELSAVRAELSPPHRALDGEEPGGDGLGAEANEEKWVAADAPAAGADVEPPAEKGGDEKESLLLIPKKQYMIVFYAFRLNVRGRARA